MLYHRGRESMELNPEWISVQVKRFYPHVLWAFHQTPYVRNLYLLRRRGEEAS